MDNTEWVWPEEAAEILCMATQTFYAFQRQDYYGLRRKVVGKSKKFPRLKFDADELREVMRVRREAGLTRLAAVRVVVTYGELPEPLRRRRNHSDQYLSGDKTVSAGHAW